MTGLLIFMVVASLLGGYWCLVPAGSDGAPGVPPGWSTAQRRTTGAGLLVGGVLVIVILTT